MKQVNRTMGWDKAMILFCLLAFLPFTSAAQQMTVTVESEGELGNQLPDSIRFTMTDLKICGPINTSDIKVIQQITSRQKAKKSNEQILTSIDLSEAKIAEGKGLMRNDANVLPAAMFLNCKALERVVLPNELAGISRSCFSGCVSLKEVVIPEVTEVIGDYAFNNCVSLQTLELPEHLKTIENHAFDGCVSLSELEMPEGLSLIDAYAFNNCSSLPETLVMPASLNTLGWGGIFNGSSIHHFDLSQCTLTGSIAENTFGECTS